MKTKTLILILLISSLCVACGKKKTEKSPEVVFVPTTPCYITADSVNIRKSPSVDSESLEKLNTGDFINIITKSFSGRQEIVKGIKGIWLEVDKPGEKCVYVFSKFVKKEEDLFKRGDVADEEMPGRKFEYGLECTGSTASEYSMHYSFLSDNRVELSGSFMDSENETASIDVRIEGYYQKLGKLLFVQFEKEITIGGQDAGEKTINRQVVLLLEECTKEGHSHWIMNEVKDSEGLSTQSGNQEMNWVEQNI